MNKLIILLLLSAVPVRAAQTVVSLTFDDGSSDHVLVGQLLNARGMKGTFYVNSGQLGTSSFYMTRANVDALKAAGHEIGGHTLNHIDMAAATPAVRQTQICNDRQNLVDWGYNPVSFAYPYGAYNAAAKAVVQGCGYQSARIVGDVSCSGCPTSETLPPPDAFAVRCSDSQEQTNTLADLQNIVTGAEQGGGGWIILVFHRICNGCDQYSTSQANLEGFLNWLQPRTAQGTIVRTVAEAMGGNQPPPAPIASSLSPSTATAGGPAFTLSVTGSNFVSGSSVTWNGALRTTTFVNANLVRAAITAADIAGSATRSVAVVNPGGAVSGSLTFTVSAPPPAPVPVPVLDSISPSTASAGSSSFALTALGSGFVSSSTVRWKGVNRATVFVNAGQLTATVLASDLAAATTAAVTVFSPGPGGGTSTIKTFTVLPPPPGVPVLASVSPSSAAVGGSSFTLTALGSGFTSSSTIRWNGADRATLFISTAQLRMTVLASEIAVPATAEVSVFTPAPGGGTSTVKTFLVYTPNPLPVLASIDPAGAVVGSSSFTLTALGSGFVSSSTVRWKGVNRATVFVSSGQLTATILASDLAAATTAAVTVFTSGPGGGASTVKVFTVSPPPPPAGALLAETFSYPNGLITNEYAHFTPTGAGAVISSTWDLLSGSLFADGQTGWTGVPNFGDPNAASSNFNNSVVFRALTKRTDFGNVSLFFNLTNQGFVATTGTPSQTWDGVHVLLRRVSATSFYYMSINRRDNTVVLKKQAGATLTSLVSGAFTVPIGAPQQILVEVNNPTPTTVLLRLTVNGVQRLAFTDAGTGGAAITGPGAIGVSGDNANFRLDDFYVMAYGAGPAAPVPVLASITPSSAAVGGSSFTLTAQGSGFVSSSTVRWNGFDRATVFVSSAQLSATMLASDLAVATAAAVTVFSPGPGGGTSTAKTFLVYVPNPLPGAPVLAQVSPSSAAAGSSSFTLTAVGDGFTSSSTVRWNGIDRDTVFVSSVELTAAVLASDLAAASTAFVTVFSPGPGGGTSTARAFTVAAPAGPIVLYSDDFNRPNAMITNEFAFFSSAAAGAVISGTWTLTAGTLYVDGGTAWTGVPDNVGPNAGSTNGTGSAVFRARTKRADYGDVTVSLVLTNQGLVTTPTTPAQAWDGVNVSLRYLSENSYYYFTVNRRDNTVVAKKKLGTVETFLASGAFTVPFSVPQNIQASVKNNPNGSVTLALTINGLQRLNVTDAASPLTAPGAVGLRGNNSNFRFDDFSVLPDGGIGVAQLPAGALAPAAAALDAFRVFPNPWRVDRHGGLPLTIDGLTDQSEVRFYTVSGRWVRTIAASGGVGTWDLNNDSGSRVASGLYLYLIKDAAGGRRRGVVAVIR